ncbi:MAG: hypothetical protein KKC68_05080 [Candidatus Thermoplasmatota archaeon]|nr:hypothetical protein [Candidatus Thermoplasmatota archaeon]MBU1941127.1 hypothetical protein [Candidatus Thermoplasmatota archaeon]
MKTTIKIAFLIIIVISISGVIIAANILQKKAIPINVSELEATTELFKGAYFTLETDKTNYTPSEDIIFIASITNQNTSSVSLYSSGVLNITSGDFFLIYKFYVYDYAYRLIWFNHTYANATVTTSHPLGIYTSMNYTLEPQQTIQAHYIWNQTKAAFFPPDEYGKPVEPGEYYIVAELLINWKGYYGIPYPLRYFGAETTIHIDSG